jgi:hypothetical protein
MLPLSHRPDHRHRAPPNLQQNRPEIPFAVRRLVGRFGLPITTAFTVAELAGLSVELRR